MARFFLEDSIKFLMHVVHKLPNRSTDLAIRLIVVTDESSSTPQHVKRLVPVVGLYDWEQPDVKSKYFFLKIIT